MFGRTLPLLLHRFFDSFHLFLTASNAMPAPNLNFWCMHWLDQIPNGYRLATVKEVQNHFNPIAGIHPVRGCDFAEEIILSLGGGHTMVLLDGYMTDPSHHHFQVQQTFERPGILKVVVKDKEWDDAERKWRTKSSACFSSDCGLLRTNLYHHIPLSAQATQIAFLYASHHWDTEVLFSLLTTITSSEELESFELAFNEHCFHSSDEYPRMVKCLLRNKFPFQLPLALDSDSKTAIDYAIQFATERPHCKEHHLRVVDLLVKLFSSEIVNSTNSEGMSFLDMAEKDANEGLIHVFTKLLSVTVSQGLSANNRESIKPRFEAVLLEAVKRGYVPLLKMMLFEFEDEMTKDGSLLVRVLKSIASRGSFHLLQKFLELYKNKITAHLAEKDEDEKTFFHYAAKSDNPDVFELLKASFDMSNSVLLREAEKKTDHRHGDVLIESRDYKGRTLLHIAAFKGNKNTVDKLLSVFGDDSVEAAKYVQETDYFGRTALQMASQGGHRDIVEVLLDNGKWDPVTERDVHGKTALHYAAQGSDPEVAVAICQLLLESCGGSSERSLLLWASAGGIGTAEEGEDVNIFVKTFLEKEKAADETHLLKEAAMRSNVQMAWELLNRGADIDDLRDLRSERPWDSSVGNVLSQLELLRERGRDQPSKEDKLGRNVFAEGLAALFLNRFIESPITVGICGEWGMGKSSLMIQTEKILLFTAAQLTFPNLLKFENFVGAKQISLSAKGRKIYQTINRGASSLFVQEEDRAEEVLLFKLYHKVKDLVKNLSPSKRHRLRQEDPLVKILQDYQPQHHAIYKSIACMDSYQLIDSTNRTTFGQQDHTLRQVPRILTIQYNAWHYRDESEAWAGLAVTVTKEIENSMTRAQWFSTCWRYTWNKNYVDICFQVFLPCFLATFLAGWIAWVFWILLKQAKFKGLMYCSIPLTIIAVVWIALKSVMSVVKPVSVQMLGYITSPDHTNRLGYQEQVISDINFLKKELGERAHWFFSFVSGEWFRDWFGLCADNVENSSIKKFKPSSEDQLRIITFVDDLDRCEEKVILQVLSAVNLVLARCKINVVMGIDKQMIERAIRRSFEDAEDNDLAEKFLCKIIQIPLSLPDPTDNERNRFLEHQLGHKLLHEISSQDDDDDKDCGTPDADAYVDEEVEENRATNDINTVVHIDCCNPSQTRCPGIIKKAAGWLMYLLRCSYSIACNISSELKHGEGQSNEQEIRPLASCEGARLTREMLISNYTEEEAQAFDKLKRFATGNQKLPREWKRLLNYHKLAWNILYKRGDVHSLPNWKVELVVWIFVCWQWKHEMNSVIKGWSQFARMDSQREDGNKRGRHGPALSQIIRNCLHESKKTEPRGNDAAKQGDGPPRNSWKKLIKALKVQDVSMKGIQLFQQFRLHCETDHLPWPVDDDLDDEEEL